jgi:hypothetical protein
MSTSNKYGTELNFLGRLDVMAFVSGNRPHGHAAPRRRSDLTLMDASSRS